MKVLKNKISEELKRIELNESLSATDISTTTLERTYWLSKTLCYLEKAERIMAGTYDGKGVASV